MYVNPALDRYWLIDYLIYDKQGDGKPKLDHVRDMLSVLVYSRPVAFSTVTNKKGNKLQHTCKVHPEFATLQPQLHQQQKTENFTIDPTVKSALDATGATIYTIKWRLKILRQTRQ